jgi:hypothetical protein
MPDSPFLGPDVPAAGANSPPAAGLDGSRHRTAAEVAGQMPGATRVHGHAMDDDLQLRHPVALPMIKDE